MAYDSRLAARVRKLIGARRSVAEREQFGGIAFLVNGNVACGIIGDDLLVRVGPERHDEAMKSGDARPFSLTGRPSKGWILVRASGLRSAAALKRWVELGMSFAKSLPAK
ncbi:MAG TPA: TfoX/Sxy family protein [bacterium]|jgi:TfoX/Sxy family transcriptional regulator of competence genes|nr:TfoX/Sxy family protein [bacterium]